MPNCRVFLASKEECMIPFDGTADGTSELIPLVLWPASTCSVQEEIIRIQIPVAEELVQRAVDLVCARFDRSIDN